jgi:hypothetical protein
MRQSREARIAKEALHEFRKRKRKSRHRILSDADAPGKRVFSTSAASRFHVTVL